MPPKRAGSTRPRTSKRARKGHPSAPPPQSQDPTDSGLSSETIIDGIYDRMKRDGLLPTTPQQVDSAPERAPSDATQVDQALAKLLSGEPQEVASPDPAVSAKAFAPLSAHLSSNIKQKIWANQFIDMATLLPDYQDSDNEEEKEKSKVKKNVKKLNIYEFSTAFQIYISTMAERHPDYTSGLLKHLATVQKMARTYGPDAWREYDTRFRRTKQAHNLSWGTVDLELYSEASLAGIKQLSMNKNPKPAQASNHSFRPNTCWVFQKYGACSTPNCKFQSTHNCYNCKGTHPTNNCSKSNNRSLKNHSTNKPHSNANKN